MTAKQELMEYIQNLTPEQVDKIVSRLPLLERCLELPEPYATYTDAFTAKLFGGASK